MAAKYAHGKKGPRASELPDLVKAELRVTISYMKAWYIREAAMKIGRGSEEDSYKFLSTYMHLLETSNPGTMSAIRTVASKEGKTLFQHLFFAFGASIAGYKHLRKVICIDENATKGKYKGCLVAASCQDGNYQIFPLAFGIVDGENKKSWIWFFQQLKRFVPDEKGLVFVSDRHVSIYAGLKTVYPHAYHGSCTVHLWRNVKSNYNVDLANLASKAARSYTVGDFRYWFEEIERQSPGCAKYLWKIGLEHWTLAYFPGMRYNIMSSNISESLNSALKKAMTFPIVTMVETIRTLLMTWFAGRREVVKNTRTRCTPEIEDILIEHLKDSTTCTVIESTEFEYQVNDAEGCVFKVDLHEKTCTCKVFDVLMVPCGHAIAACGLRGIDFYSLVGDCYSTSTWIQLWGDKILPPPRREDCYVPGSIPTDTGCPNTRRGSWRPKLGRYPSQGEPGQPGRKGPQKHCGTCGQTGHNRATCKTPI